MNVSEAYKKAIKYLGRSKIDYCVNVRGGWVFLGQMFPQALYIDDNTVKGLSPHLDKDKGILREAQEKIKNGDFY